MVIYKITENPIHFSKKQRNSLKTDFFPHQLDFLNLSNQAHSLVATLFVKLIFGSWFGAKENGANHNFGKDFFYSFAFQHLYPKHSFW